MATLDFTELPTTCTNATVTVIDPPTDTPTSTYTPTPTRTPTSTPTSTPTVTPTVRQANGGSCSAGSGCLSTFCVTGVCCDQACNGPDDVCAVPGYVGICVTIVKPTPTRTPRLCNGCPADFNADGRVSIDELVMAVDAALNGCTAE